jgi:hypothetical protein
MPAATPEANRVTEMLANHAILTAKLLSYGQYLTRAFPNQSVTMLTATAPDAPLPFERTTRAAIPETIRSEVWRRDGGRCVRYRANQNLKFDHIIPVALCGATSARNLQLLCRSCNREKSRSIQAPVTATEPFRPTCPRDAILVAPRLRTRATADLQDP